MKNIFTLGLVAFTLITATANAQTEQNEPKNLVTITGNLDPAYSVEMSAADRAALAQGLEGINNMPSLTVDINSIYSEKDKPAFEAASKEVSRVLLEAAKKLVDMRAIVYKLDISLQQDANHRFTQNIYTAYNKKFQSSFTDLLQLFLGTNADFNANLTNAMETCFTTSCLQDIASAQLDLIEFGRSINTRIDLNSKKQWEYKSGGFKSRLVKDAVRFTMDEVLKTNTEQNAYVQMLRIAATPFVAAAAGTNQAFENLSDFIHSKKLGRYLIAANPIVKKTTEWAESQKTFEARVGENYELIVEYSAGAMQYVPEDADAKEFTAPFKMMEVFKDDMGYEIAIAKKITVRSGIVLLHGNEWGSGPGWGDDHQARFHPQTNEVFFTMEGKKLKMKRVNENTIQFTDITDNYTSVFIKRIKNPKK